MEKKLDFDIKNFGTVIFFVALFIFLSIFANGFLSVENLINVTRQISMVGIVSVGMSCIILTGGIDLSAGSVLAATGCMTAYLMVNLQMNMYAACIIGIAMGGTIGLVNGFLITKLLLPPFVATLATQTAARGLAYIITHATPIFGFPKAFEFIGQGYVGAIPTPVIIMIIILFIGFVILYKLPFGRHVYAIGGNEEAAKLVGINADRVKIIVYLLQGLLVGLAGVVYLSRMNTGIPSSGANFELDVITAVILGGVSVTGGEGKLRGVVLGVLIMGILSNGLIILNVQEYYQWLIRGLVLVLAVAFDKNSYKFIRKRRTAD